MVNDFVQKFTKVYQAAIKVNMRLVSVYRDGLTELKNCSTFLEDISNIDINNLKQVNDTLGYLVGDMLLHRTVDEF